MGSRKEKLFIGAFSGTAARKMQDVVLRQLWKSLHSENKLIQEALQTCFLATSSKWIIHDIVQMENSGDNT